MMIKSFTAESAAAALKQVRSEMGGDAVVLKTRHVTDGAGQKRIEVTACLDKPPVTQQQKTVGERANLMGGTTVEPRRITESRRVTEPRWTPVKRDGSESTAAPTATAPTSDDRLAEITARFTALEAKLEKLTSNGSTEARFESKPQVVPEHPEIEELRKRFVTVDLPAVFSSVFLSTLEREHPDADSLTDEAARLLTESISELIAPSLEFNPGDVVVFIGAAGTGKTSLMGKLAAQLVVEQKKKVRLLSLDTSKVGAHDEIESYAAILGIDIATGTDAEEVSSPDSVTLIDTPALPNATEAFASFARQLDLIKPSHRIAVFSALTRSGDTIRQARQIRVLNPTSFAMTMLDLTPSHGPIVAAADTLTAKLALVSDAPGGMGKARRPEAATLVNNLLHAEVDDE